MSESEFSKIQKKLMSWACADVQKRRGRGSIVFREKATIVPIGREINDHEYSPVVKVTVPVILESRKETIDEVFYSRRELERIMRAIS